MGGVAVGARSVGVVRVGVGTRSANRPPSLGDGGSGVEGGGGASLHLSGCHMGSRARRNGRVHRVQSRLGGVLVRGTAASKGKLSRTALT